MTYKTPEEALEAVQPICANCKHCHVDDWGDYECEPTLHYWADRVSGYTYPTRTSCKKERESSYGDHCGPLGKNFEQKEPETEAPSWLQRVIAWFSPLEDDDL